jgi:hypothetical protein
MTSPSSILDVSSARYLVIWEFLVKPESRISFEKAYGPEGDWVQLFRSSREFLGTQLLRDLNQPGRYLTVDNWTSREARVKFKRSHHTAYVALDESCEALTERENLVGEFESPRVTCA